jgi:hypothetical protein
LRVVMMMMLHGKMRKILLLPPVLYLEGSDNIFLQIISKFLLDCMVLCFRRQHYQNKIYFWRSGVDKGLQCLCVDLNSDHAVYNQWYYCFLRKWFVDYCWSAA